MTDARGNHPLALAEQRRSRGIPLKSVAEATKISIQFLRAIEAEEFDKLPGGIFNTSYIRQYAEFTSADELDILASYLAFTNASAPPSLQPEFGMTRAEHGIRRLLAFVRRQTHTRAETDVKGPILDT